LTKDLLKDRDDANEEYAKMNREDASGKVNDLANELQQRKETYRDI